MTTITPTENDTIELDLQNPANYAPVDDGFVEDTDPMIAEMEAAEAEIAALDKTGGEETVKDEPAQQPPAQPAAQPSGKGETPMVPKPRFDEVLSERDLLRDQVGYLRGLVDAGTQARAQAQQPAPSQQQKPQETSQNQASGSVVDDLETAINAAEAKKLELAERYDNGELSTKQWKEQELLIDKEIRLLSSTRLDQVKEDSRAQAQAHAQAVVDAQQYEQWVERQGLAIQNNHPNVGLIDAHPMANSIWNGIAAQAAQNLASRGIDARMSEQDPRVKLAVMQERAALTDRYSVETIQQLYGDFRQNFDASKYQKQPVNNGQEAPGQKQPSAIAINRGQKLDLAASQPPSIADMGVGGNSNLTAADIEKMSEDQIADLLEKAPNLIQRVLGN